MATVTNTVKLPDGSTPDRVDVVIELVASTTARAAGWVTATDVTLEATVRPTVTNGAWTASLTPNADITPSGSVYKVTEYVDKTRYTHYIEVGSGGGSLFDLLVDPPASLATAASEVYADAAVAAHTGDVSAAHAATAISFATTADGPVRETDVQAAVTAAARQWSSKQAPMLLPVASSESPTVGSLATSTAISSGRLWHSIPYGGDSTAVALPSHFTDRFGNGSWARYGSAFPNYQYARPQNVTDAVNGYNGSYSIEFATDALEIEFLFKGLASKSWVWIDDKPVGGVTPTWTSSATGSTYFAPLSFASRAHRRIRFECDAHTFGGVITDANATVQATSNHRLKCVAVGDSFTEGSNPDVGTFSAWARLMGHLLDWDVMPSGLGGTGYLNPGSGGRVKFRDRVQNDVIDRSPDVVVVAGGFNDYAAYTAAAVGAEASLLFAAIRAGLPRARLVVVSPFSSGGHEDLTTNLYKMLDVKDALETAAAAANALWVDVQEIPLRSGVSAVGTLTSSSLVGATSLAMSVPVPIGSTIEVDTGTARERRVTTSLSGSSSPFTVGVAAMSVAHSSGVVAKLVGPSLWTGTGRVGSTTGSGNSDLLVSSDATHPTQSGHDAIALAVAAQICAGW